jgi:hypothetical protein
VADADAATLELLRRGDFAAAGIGSHRLERLRADGTLTVVRPGVYVRADAVDGLTPEDRIVVRARALALVSRRPPVFSHITAAALHGPPIYGVQDRSVHAIVPDSRSSACQGLVRHRGPLRDDEVEQLCGLPCTSLVRTIADLARTAGRETATCAADAALRRVSTTTAYDGTAASEFRTAARETARRAAHGVRRAERVLDFADGRAQLPGESVSRIRLSQLGFAAPRLQVHVPGPFGENFYVDFGLDDVHAFGEFDGLGKYTDARLRKGLSAEQIVVEEKRREDWIRGTTTRAFARWGWDHIGSPWALGRHLSAFGLTPPA